MINPKSWRMGKRLEFTISIFHPFQTVGIQSRNVGWWAVYWWPTNQNSKSVLSHSLLIQYQFCCFSTWIPRETGCLGYQRFFLPQFFHWSMGAMGGRQTPCLVPPLLLLLQQLQLQLEQLLEQRQQLEQLLQQLLQLELLQQLLQLE